MIITPGYTFTSTEAVTAGKLNQLGAPTGELEQSDLDDAVDEVQTQLGSGVARPNYFLNPGLDVWTRGTTAVSCAVGTRQLRADSWWTRCNATSANLPTYLRVSNAAQNFLYGAQIVGETGVGSVDFGQDIAARVSALFTPNITVTFTISNGTAASLTPQVRLDTCDVLEVYSAVTNAAATNVTSPVASGATTTCSVTLSLSGSAAALRRGALLYIRIPSGALDSSIKNVTISALKVEDGTAATAVLVERDPADPTDLSVADREFLFNGGMDLDRWVATPAACAAGTDTYGPMGWWTNPSAGSDMTVSRSATAPNSSTKHSALLTGSVATSGTVDFGQNIEAKTATRLARPCVFSCYVYNGTGGAITPQIRIDTCTVSDVFSAVGNQESQNAVSCANGAWTRISLSFDGSTYTNLANGCRIYVRFTAGALDDPAATVRIAQAKLELGAVVHAYDPAPSFEPGLRVPMVSGLAIHGPTSTTVRVTCDFVALPEISGLLRTASAVDVTIDSATTGANGLDTSTTSTDTVYYVWLIGNRTTVAGLLSLSDTAPAMPAGYTYKLRAGWMYNAATGGFTACQQSGRSVRYVTRQLFATKAASTSWQSLLTVSTLSAGYLAKFAPTWARQLHGIIEAGTMSATNRVTFAAGTVSSEAIGQTIAFLPSGNNIGHPSTETVITECAIPLAPHQANLDAYVLASSTGTFTLHLTGFDF